MDLIFESGNDRSLYICTAVQAPIMFTVCQYLINNYLIPILCYIYIAINIFFPICNTVGLINFRLVKCGSDNNSFTENV